MKHKIIKEKREYVVKRVVLLGGGTSINFISFFFPSLGLSFPLTCLDRNISNSVVSTLSDLRFSPRPHKILNQSLFFMDPKSLAFNLS